MITPSYPYRPSTASFCRRVRPGRACTAMLAALWLSVVLCLSTVQAAVTTEVSFNDPAGAYSAYYAPLISHVQAGMANWTGQLTQDVTVRVVIRFSGSTGTTADGRSFTNAFSHADGARNVQMEGLAAKLTGLIPNSNTAPDVDIFVNPSYLMNELWFDPEPTQRTVPLPANKTDAMSTFTHEICHALGFAGFLNLTTGERPAGYESAFDEHTVFDGKNFFFTGASAVGIYGSPVPLTYGNTYHLGNSAPRPGADLLPEYLMNGVYFTRGKRYYVSPPELAMLKDTGLDLSAPSQSGPPVSLAVTTPIATPNGTPGVFTLSIPAALPSDLTISYAVKGSAVNGVDYVFFKGTTKIKAGKTSKALKVKAEGDLGGASKKTVKLTLVAGTGYTVGTTEDVKIKIVPGS